MGKDTKTKRIIEIAICDNCGKELDPEAIYCIGCGRGNPKIRYKKLIINE